ncbi:triphosphoribosyl-dephospho-CoA synthase CitG [Vagococcus zengguangii]|uniref:triphosphoribosyl-dephospho-CoA synthase CitG n=1 Tax=Vagococcus zengguangii TaxID=2571750 RepID=UPI00143DED0B|nr:triphosphoribosyl-dephospho-CoA synthase CitG [Vagococcus zengguangii]
MFYILNKIANLATEALIIEATLTPKPGLVDTANSGAHDDMDFFLFIKSALSLEKYFNQYLTEGYYHKGSPTELFKKIRIIGIEAEKDMFATTEQVNTHKGANFSLALLLSSMGYHLKNGLPEDYPLFLGLVFNYIKKMTTDLSQQDFETLETKKELTHGEKLYLKHGIKGIRGEAEAGFPTLNNVLSHHQILSQNKNKKKHYLLALLYIMSILEDSNIINRGGHAALKMVQHRAHSMFERYLSNDSEDAFIEEILRFDNQLITQHLSSGGAADILGLYIFIEEVRTFSRNHFNISNK